MLLLPDTTFVIAEVLLWHHSHPFFIHWFFYHNISFTSSVISALPYRRCHILNKLFINIYTSSCLLDSKCSFSGGVCSFNYYCGKSSPRNSLRDIPHKPERFTLHTQPSPDQLQETVPVLCQPQGTCRLQAELRDDTAASPSTRQPPSDQPGWPSHSTSPSFPVFSRIFPFLHFFRESGPLDIVCGCSRKKCCFAVTQSSAVLLKFVVQPVFVRKAAL